MKFSALKWKNVIMMLITDEKQSSKLQSRMIYSAFAVIALAMSVVNIFTMRIPLLIATASFAVLCLADLVLSLISQRCLRVANYLFMLEIGALFMFFLITGGTDNFSVLWLLLLPSLGLFYFGRRNGTLLCALMMAAMLALFHIPGLRAICTDYGDTFRLRFPLLFTATYGVGLLLETVRYTTAKELQIMRDQYKFQSYHDALTEMYNRHAFKEVRSILLHTGMTRTAFALLDIDWFKKINDTYGHDAGDLVLKDLAQIIRDTIPQEAQAYRWGGEEFMIVYKNCDKIRENAKALCDAVREHTFKYGETEIHITISMGLVVQYGALDEGSLDGLITCADNCLYQAKNEGRNRIIFKSIV